MRPVLLAISPLVFALSVLGCGGSAATTPPAATATTNGAATTA